MNVDWCVPRKPFPRMWLTYLLTGCALLIVLAACSSFNKSDSNSTSPRPAPDVWTPVYTGMAGYVNANATWQAPAALTVEHSQKIGLAIGQSDALSSKINGLLPNTNPSPAGQITVGPFVRARLEANPADADVIPSDMVNESTLKDVNLLWTWIVYPKRPMSSLPLIAHVEVPLAGNPNPLTTDLPLNIPVHGTFGYWVGRIFSNWATWSAIGVAVAGGVGWIVRRIRRRNQPSSEPPSSAQAPPPDRPNSSSESKVESTGPPTGVEGKDP